MKIYRSAIIFLSLALLGGLLGAIGCGNTGVGSLTDPSTVSAQQGYSNQSLSGVYAYTETGYNPSQPFSGVGTLNFNGQGSVTGTITLNYLGSPACTFSISGQVSVTGSGAGSGTFTSTTNASGCTPTNGTVSLQAAQQGQAILIAETDGQHLASGIAMRQ